MTVLRSNSRLAQSKLGNEGVVLDLLWSTLLARPSHLVVSKNDEALEALRYSSSLLPPKSPNLSRILAKLKLRSFSNMIFATLLLSVLASLTSVSALPTPNPSGSSVFRVLSTNSNTAAAMPQGPPPPPSVFNSTSIKATSRAEQVVFDACPVPAGGSPPAGVVHDITISPCSRSSPSEPCHFHHGQNYTIDISYTTYLSSEQPRSGLLARDDRTDPSESYPYSGQTFGGCSYTDCPVQAGKLSKYTYEFDTLASPFNYLTFNLTQDFDGPSLFCAGFAAQFVDDEKVAAPGGGVKTAKKPVPKNPKKAQPVPPTERLRLRR
ncbi:hypothetical protein JCM16303_002604 [Sporobolomyces ruberrimus]